MKPNNILTSLSLALGAALIPAFAAEPTTGTPGSASAVEARHRSHLPMSNTVRQSYVKLSIADDPNNSDRLVKPEDAIRAALGRQ